MEELRKIIMELKNEQVKNFKDYQNQQKQIADTHKEELKKNMIKIFSNLSMKHGGNYYYDSIEEILNQYGGIDVPFQMKDVCHISYFKSQIEEYKPEIEKQLEEDNKESLAIDLEIKSLSNEQLKDIMTLKFQDEVFKKVDDRIREKINIEKEDVLEDNDKLLFLRQVMKDHNGLLLLSKLYYSIRKDKKSIYFLYENPFQLLDDDLDELNKLIDSIEKKLKNKEKLDDEGLDSFSNLYDLFINKILFKSSEYDYPIVNNDNDDFLFDTELQKIIIEKKQKNNNIKKSKNLYNYIILDFYKKTLDHIIANKEVFKGIFSSLSDLNFILCELKRRWGNADGDCKAKLADIMVKIVSQVDELEIFSFKNQGYIIKKVIWAFILHNNLNDYFSLKDRIFVIAGKYNINM